MCGGMIVDGLNCLSWPLNIQQIGTRSDVYKYTRIAKTANRSTVNGKFCSHTKPRGRSKIFWMKE